MNAEIKANNKQKVPWKFRKAIKLYDRVQGRVTV